MHAIRVPDEAEDRNKAKGGERDFLVLYDDAEPRQAYRVERVRPDERHEVPPRENDRERGEDRRQDEPPPLPQRRRRRLIIAAVVAAILIVAAAMFGWYWFTTLRRLESTDDAYTQADNTVISPKVAG